jgi:ribosome-binding protein aMBF1 (putative translation factor)
MMGEPQIIRTPSGEEMVVVSRAEYEALRAAADEALDDAEDLAIAHSRWEAWNASGRLVTPPDVAQSLLEGHHVLTAFRTHRGVSIDELARRTGIDPSLIRSIEGREIDGDAETMSRLSDGLPIDPIWLSPSPAPPK